MVVMRSWIQASVVGLGYGLIGMIVGIGVSFLVSVLYEMVTMMLFGVPSAIDPGFGRGMTVWLSRVGFCLGFMGGWMTVEEKKDEDQ